MFGYLLSYFKFPFTWNKAIDAASRGEHEVALSYLIEVRRFARKYPDILILTGLVKHRMGRHGDAIEDLKGAYSILNNRTMKPDNKAYLKCCISIAGTRAAQDFGDQSLWDFTIDYNSFDLDKVSKHYKEKFPLLYHQNRPKQYP